MDATRFLKAIEYDRDYRRQILHVEPIPAREAVYAEPAQPLKPEILAALSAAGIERLYAHQAESVDAVRAGRDVVVVTGTASGKTLCYNLPVLERWLENRPLKALYLYPTKALAQDQLRGLLRMKELHPALAFGAGTYDGDTPPETRTKLRDGANLILTNPDMLHSGILPSHPKWGEFFSNLEFVVLDEVHTYRGIFGSNVANVMRRLERICAHYGSHPRIIACSATIANPVELTERLTGREMTLIDRDGAPRGPRQLVFWNPPLVDEASMERYSPNVEAERLMVALIRERVQTITFVQARVLAELIYRYSQEALQRISPSLSKAVRAYRGGYLPQDRREIEQLLFSGELLGVVSTNALELGIDVGGLDACVIVGYPGSIASTWQRAGRAGRGDEEALVVLIARNNPIDQYLIHHHEYFLGQSPENAIIDPDNPHISVGHLRCAAMELPLKAEELRNFGEFAPAIVEILEDDKQLKRIRNEWYWSGGGYPAADVNLRNIGDNTYTIVDTTSENQVIGSLDELSAFTQLHTEAIYLHEAETYFVQKLDLQERVAYVKKEDVDYFTQAITETKIRVDATEQQKRWRVSEVFFGDVTVTAAVIMFKKIKFHGMDSIGFGNLDLPPRELETVACWVVPPLAALHKVRDHGRVPTEGMLGIANVITQVVPLFVMCDFTDIGAVVDSSCTGTPTLFVYDKYPGGLGFAQKTYDMIEEVMQAGRALIAECPCERGCPSCVGSTHRTFSYVDADAESRERIPDKDAALIILHELLEMEPYVPKPLTPEEIAAGTSPGAQPPPAPVKRLPTHVETKVRKQLQGMKGKG